MLGISGYYGKFMCILLRLFMSRQALPQILMFCTPRWTGLHTLANDPLHLGCTPRDFCCETWTFECQSPIKIEIYTHLLSLVEQEHHVTAWPLPEGKMGKFGAKWNEQPNICSSSVTSTDPQTQTGWWAENPQYTYPLYYCACILVGTTFTLQQENGWVDEIEPFKSWC